MKIKIGKRDSLSSLEIRSSMELAALINRALDILRDRGVTIKSWPDGERVLYRLALIRGRFVYLIEGAEDAAGSDSGPAL